MLRLTEIEIHPYEETPGASFIVIPSGVPGEEDEIATLDPTDTAMAAAYFLRLAEEVDRG